MNEKLFNEVRTVLAKQLRKPEDIIKPESRIIEDESEEEDDSDDEEYEIY